GSPNPRGFTTERDFHWRFESRFVGAHVALDEVIRAVPPGTRVLDDVRSAVLDFIAESNRQVEPLYRLEQRFGFSADRAAPEEKAFAIARLAAAADMLRSIWYTAWVDSEAVAA